MLKFYSFIHSPAVFISQILLMAVITFDWVLRSELCQLGF